MNAGMLEEDLLGDFENAMSLREEADYAMNFSEDGARRVVSDAERFMRAANDLLEEQKKGRVKDSGRREKRG